MTHSIEKISEGVAQMIASGGGDTPEAVADGFHEVARLSWRPHASKTVVWVADGM